MSTFDQLPKAQRRKLLRLAVLRPTLTAIALLLLYFTLPLDRAFSVMTLLGLTAGLFAVGLLFIFQTRAIRHAQYPRLAAIEALAVSAPAFILLFATGYYLMEHSQSNAFTQPMTRLDSLYFTVTVFSSVGFGDISPRSELARAVTTLQMLGDLVVIGLAVRVILNAVQSGLAARAQAAPPDEPGGAPS